MKYRDHSQEISVGFETPNLKRLLNNLEYPLSQLECTPVLLGQE